MEIDRKLIQAFQKYAQELKDGCSCNDGWLPIEKIKGTQVPERAIPEQCEKCAPIRELELCWHETIVTRRLPTGDRLGEWENHWKCSCGKTGTSLGDYSAGDFVANHNALCNPDFTTKLHGTVWYVRHVLEVLGLWERFVDDVNPISPVLRCTGGQENGYKLSTNEINKFADILTNGTHLRDAALAFMEGVANNG